MFVLRDENKIKKLLETACHYRTILLEEILKQEFQEESDPRQKAGVQEEMKNT